MKKSLPKKILVYQFDKVDGVPIYSVARTVDDISDDMHGRKVGIYILKRTRTFRVRRRLRK